MVRNQFQRSRTDRGFIESSPYFTHDIWQNNGAIHYKLVVIKLVLVYSNYLAQHGVLLISLFSVLRGATDAG